MPINSFRYMDMMNRTMEYKEAFSRLYDYVIAKDPEVVGAEEIGAHTQICRELTKYGTPDDVANCTARGLRFVRLYALAAVVSMLALARHDTEDVGNISTLEYLGAKREAMELMEKYKESPALMFEEGSIRLFEEIGEEAAETTRRNQRRDAAARGR